MCTVIGYIGKEHSKSFIFEGLTRLEYRGYDSAGFACLHPTDHRLLYCKSKGSVVQLAQKIDKNPIDGYIGIGHTRWSTHGIASDSNAHPHFDCQKKISLVHNGIIENCHSLRQQLLQEGHIFHSQTDSEVVAHLLESLLATHHDIKIALLALVHLLEGAFSLIFLIEDYPDMLIAIRKKSPLCIGVGDGEMFVASDVLAFSERSRQVIFLPDESCAIITQDQVKLFNFFGDSLEVQPQLIDALWVYQGKQGFEHFMLKEIYEQKKVLYDTVEFFKSISSRIWEHTGFGEEYIQSLRRIVFMACGTSFNASRIAQFFFEKIAHIQTISVRASEFKHAQLFVEPDMLFCAISQSGETADTLEALRMVKNLKGQTMAITNVPSSSMVREAQGFLLTQAQQEIAVASTKSFTAQIGLLFLLAHRIALSKNLITQAAFASAHDDLLVAAEALENGIENYKYKIIHELAPFYANFKQFIFIGRHMSYAFALEAALKLKEIAYIFVDCYPAGELKHGPLALVDEKTPVVIFSAMDDAVYRKLVANAQEIKARMGHIIAFAFEGQHELIALADCVFVFPRLKNDLLMPLVCVGVMQFFVYHIARVLNHPIDKPRNLAKSVTVE